MCRHSFQSTELRSPGTPVPTIVWRNACAETRFRAYTICESALATRYCIHIRLQGQLFKQSPDLSQQVEGIGSLEGESQ
jgi:hypothetical protein